MRMRLFLNLWQMDPFTVMNRGDLSSKLVVWRLKRSLSFFGLLMSSCYHFWRAVMMWSECSQVEIIWWSAMVADFKAFRTHAVLQSLQKKIQAVEIWQEKVLVGLSDGTLMVLEPDSENLESPYQVVKAMRGFGKNCIYQLQVWSWFHRSVSNMLAGM